MRAEAIWHKNCFLLSTGGVILIYEEGAENELHSCGWCHGRSTRGGVGLRERYCGDQRVCGLPGVGKLFRRRRRKKRRDKGIMLQRKRRILGRGFYAVLPHGAAAVWGVCHRLASGGHVLAGKNFAALIHSRNIHRERLFLRERQQLARHNSRSFMRNSPGARLGVFRQARRKKIMRHGLGKRRSARQKERIPKGLQLDCRTSVLWNGQNHTASAALFIREYVSFV